MLQHEVGRMHEQRVHFVRRALDFAVGGFAEAEIPVLVVFRPGQQAAAHHLDISGFVGVGEVEPRFAVKAGIRQFAQLHVEKQRVGIDDQLRMGGVFGLDDPAENLRVFV